MSSNYAAMSGRDIRALCRSGAFHQPTAGVATAFAQANLVVLHSADAEAFTEFCRLNPRPCPLLAKTCAGDYEPKSLAPCSDLRTDLPQYRVFQNGVCIDKPTEIRDYWNRDCVAFLIGCSFTFESALLKSGVPVRHIAEGCNVPMYRSNIECLSSGPFATPLVVSMRPMTEIQAEHARRITAEFPQVHGAPIHQGDPAAIGIADLSKHDYGDAVTVRPNEIPAFWSRGVPPMQAVVRAKLDFAVTHEPGHMFVTDLPNDSLRESSAAK